MQQKITTMHAVTKEHNRIMSVIETEVLIAQAHEPENSYSMFQHEKMTAIWDTGATNSVITKNVVTKIGLKAIGITQVNTAGGKLECNVFMINMFLPNNIGIPNIRATEGILGGNIDVLIGMDIISKGDFAITNTNGKTVFSFQIPSIYKIDFNDLCRKNPRTQLQEVKNIFA